MTHKTLLRYSGYVFSVGGSRVAGILISSLTFPYLVRHLGVQMYGLWSYVIALCGFLDVIANPGLASYATQQVAAHRELGFELIPDFLFLRLLSSCVAVVVLLVIASFETRADVRQLVYLYGIGNLFVSLLSSDQFLASLEMFHARSVLRVTQQVLYALTIFAFVRVPGDVIWLPVGILGSSALTGFTGWALMWRGGFKIRPIVQPGRWWGMLVPSAHYALATLMSSIYRQTGHLLVRWFLGDYALGMYAAAVRFVDLLRSFVVMVLYVLMPRLALAAKSEPGLRRLAQFALAAMAIISIPLTAGLISTASLLVPWVLGPKFVGDISLVRWMAPYLITASAASLFAGTILYASGRHRAYLASTMSGAVVGVVLYLILIPVMGVTGAGLAFVLAEAAVAIAGYALLPPGLRGIWKSPIIGISLAATFVMVIAVRCLILYAPRVSLVIPAGVFVYLVSCGWFVRRWLVASIAHQDLSSPA